MNNLFLQLKVYPTFAKGLQYSATTYQTWGRSKRTPKIPLESVTKIFYRRLMMQKQLCPRRFKKAWNYIRHQIRIKEDDVLAQCTMSISPKIETSRNCIVRMMRLCRSRGWATTSLSYCITSFKLHE